MSLKSSSCELQSINDMDSTLSLPYFYLVNEGDRPPPPPAEDYPIHCTVELRDVEFARCAQELQNWEPMMELLFAVPRRVVQVCRHAGDYTFVTCTTVEGFDLIGCTLYRACLKQPKIGMTMYILPHTASQSRVTHADEDTDEPHPFVLCSSSSLTKAELEDGQDEDMHDCVSSMLSSVVGQVRRKAKTATFLAGRNRACVDVSLTRNSLSGRPSRTEQAEEDRSKQCIPDMRAALTNVDTNDTTQKAEAKTEEAVIEHIDRATNSTSAVHMARRWARRTFTHRCQSVVDTGPAYSRSATSMPSHVYSRQTKHVFVSLEMSSSGVSVHRHATTFSADGRVATRTNDDTQPSFGVEGEVGKTASAAAAVTTMIRRSRNVTSE